MSDDRRAAGKIRFDWSINVSNIIAIISLILTFATYGQKVITYLSNVNSKVNIMWIQFAKEHPEVATEYRLQLEEAK